MNLDGEGDSSSHQPAGRDVNKSGDKEDKASGKNDGTEQKNPTAPQPSVNLPNAEAR
jgi:hypothetical protein